MGNNLKKGEKPPPPSGGPPQRPANTQKRPPTGTGNQVEQPRPQSTVPGPGPGPGPGSNAAKSGALSTPAKAPTVQPLAPGEAEVDAELSRYSCQQAMTVESFDLLKVLGKGSYGKVMLCKKIGDPTGTLFAMKTLRKAALIKRGQLAHTRSERLILEKIHNPFLTHLVFAFQTPDKLYMVLEYMPGGELFYWLKKDKKFSEVRARLYTAEITLALEALHAANIVYRDLKPENILLDAEGHIKLTDFGLAKDNITGPGAEGGTKTFCGTPEYLAPEILENTGHGKAVDWWALGTLLYEMVAGLPPFYDNNVQRMYHKILHEPLRFPKPEQTPMSEPLKALVRGLLERKISGRTGSGPMDAQELKSSKFLSVLNFERVMQKAEKPEFKPPEMRSETDTRNFDTEFTRERPQDSLVDVPMSSTLEQKTQFADFTFDGQK